MNEVQRFKQLEKFAFEKSGRLYEGDAWIFGENEMFEMAEAINVELSVYKDVAEAAQNLIDVMQAIAELGIKNYHVPLQLRDRKALRAVDLDHALSKLPEVKDE